MEEFKIFVKKKSTKVVAIPLIIFAVVLATFAPYLFPREADATLAGFSAGNIMSDYVMSNKNSMSEAQIQAFLKSKNSCNKAIDYHGYSGTTSTGFYYTYSTRDGHYVCMADEFFGDNGLPSGNQTGQTAAHIIWQAAQDYSINPQVLIVLLQKEQSLITDTYPSTLEYTKATGFCVPDFGPCNDPQPGLIKQVRKAASLFREVLDGGWTNYPIGNNYIQYNPNTACGGTNVYIENRATSALYRYTPYQPNAHAMGGGSSSAYPQCGAFGNRNFYNYFTDWFGSTQTTYQAPITGKIATTQGTPIGAAGYVTADGVQHAISATDDGIYETWWGAGYSPTTGKLSSLSNISSIGAYSMGDGTQHVISVTSTGGVYETWWGIFSH